ncbi:hypothetical protein RO1_31440 [Roseburia intestinalis XB6B4]|uniref:Uncharacterized protein n=1 Tax=Roseburia intestinalis XB6B4 TaxID=718255 RepID=D4L1J1_9FIRM|nr:hypothetical protein RO1_31440 [Roseburia intestinalis XB6B4]
MLITKEFPCNMIWFKKYFFVKTFCEIKKACMPDFCIHALFIHDNRMFTD